MKHEKGITIRDANGKVVFRSTAAQIVSGSLDGGSTWYLIGTVPGSRAGSSVRRAARRAVRLREKRAMRQARRA